MPIWVISIGGVLTSDPSILEIEHVFHLSGSKDRIQYAGMVLYPGCWPIMCRSAWNQALAQDKRTVIPVGLMKHVSHGDYFSHSMRLPDGTPYAQHTVAVIAEVVATVLASTKLGQLAQSVGAEAYLIDEGGTADAQRSV